MDDSIENEELFNSGDQAQEQLDLFDNNEEFANMISSLFAFDELLLTQDAKSNEILASTNSPTCSMPSTSETVKATFDESSQYQEQQQQLRDEFSVSIYKLLKQIHPDCEVSSNAMLILNTMINNIFEGLVKEASQVAAQNGGVSITSRDIQTAVRRLLPNELGRNAIMRGANAVTKLSNLDNTSK